MRLPLACLALATALPVAAQGAERHWYLDVHRFTPSMTGDFQGTSGGNPMDVDLQNDLGLARDKTRIGFGAAYEGPRFGLELSRDAQDYAGSNTIARAVTINGQTFAAATLVSSSLKATSTTLNWTIRACRWPGFWLGVDLGARATQLDLDASGAALSTSYSTTLPVPQLGPSLGFAAGAERLVGRASYHLLEYKGCSYYHANADLRYFPLSWLGVMAFYDDERFRVPRGSIKSDMDITLDRSGTGLGLVARF